MRAISCVAAVLIVAVGVRAEDAADARKAVVGKWKLVGFERGGIGQPDRLLPTGAMTFDKDGGFTGSFPDHEMGGTVTIDPTRTPAAMDFAHAKEPDKGKTMRGIYKVEGNKLTLCAAPPGRAAKDRPTTFATKGTDNVLFVFERAK